MPTPSDLHRDDLVARIDLRAALRGLREESDLSCREVTRLAGFQYVEAVHGLERQTSWEVWRVQRWSRGLQHRFRPTITGLEVAPDDTHSLILRAATLFGAFDEDQMWLRLLAADLQRTRMSRRITTVEFGRRCGVPESAVRHFEDNLLTAFLRTYQRYTRALGGVLDLRLEPARVVAA